MMPNTAPPESGGDSSKKVAIIVVHGVSDQQPYDSARSIANLLLHTNKEQPPLDTNKKQPPLDTNEEQSLVHAKEEEPRYSAWHEQLIGIPVRRIPVCKPIPLCKRTKHLQPNVSGSKGLLRGLFELLELEERGKRIRRYLDSKDTSTAKQNIEENIEEKAHAFTCDFFDSDSLKKDLKARFYETICIKACRDDQHEVHLYEMYWADLSRVGRGFFQVFSEFYQILFHLSALGRHTLDMAALEHPEKFQWRCYASLHGWAGRILSIPIPLLNLFLVVAALLNLVGNIPDSYSSSVASVILSLLGIFLLGCVFWKNAMKLPLPGLFLPGIVILAFIRSSWCKEFSYKLLAFEWLVVLAILVCMLIYQYSLRRPGADKVAIGLGLLAVLALWDLVFKVENSPVGILKLSLKLIELIYCFLVVSWILFFCLYFVVLIWGWFAQRGLTVRAKERAKRASWTASVSLWIPSISFISVTLTLWAALANVAASLLPKDHGLYCDDPASLLPKDYDPYCLASPLPKDYPYRPTDWFRNWLSLEDTYDTPSDFINELIVDPVLGIAICSIVIVLLLMAWSFLPSVWAEVQPPESTPQTDNHNCDKKLSLKFGIWLNNGYRTVHFFLPAISALFIILVIAYFILIPIKNSWIADNSSWIADNTDLSESIKKTLFIIGTLAKSLAVILTASTTSILVLGSRLQQLSGGIGNVIDVILDVDNYLRLHPIGDNPRTRIFSRYYSLLRYLCEQKDSQNQPKYDALILVAHSQGAVITADLLRFIKKEEPKGLDPLLSSDSAEKLPVYFFSMGNPLRQLYSVGFPHLYEWVINYNEPDENGPNNYDQNGLGDKPKPEDLGLEQWVNTYNSGDYVGRYLWRKSKSEVNEKKLTREEKLFKPSSSVEDKDNISEKGKYREFCLGAGAHTHYWNATTNRVADEINRLIDKATRS
jgi:hypothetical protein